MFVRRLSFVHVCRPDIYLNEMNRAFVESFRYDVEQVQNQSLIIYL